MARGLTNLECVALAHIWRIGPCTAHELRQAFANSSAGRYSGSAGAIYPLVKRLEAAGFIISKPDANGAQKKRVYSIQKRGRQSTKKWLCALDEKGIFPDDPLKTRFQYIMMLNKNEREAWVHSANEALLKQDVMARIEYAADEYQNPIDQHMLAGILEMNRQRRRWLQKAGKTLPEMTNP